MRHAVNPQWTLVFAAGLITALATGLGALPFLVLRRITAHLIGLANAAASGLMLGASFGLLLEGSRVGAAQTVAGGALGVAFIALSERLLDGREIAFGEMSAHGAKKTVLMLLIMTAHSFAEGIAVGVAFGGGEQLAAMITIAIAVHNIPEGLAISAVMRPKGASIASCAGSSIVSSLPQPLMAVPAFVFVEAVRPVLPYGLGFAAGAMVYMVFLELLPEAYESVKPRQVGAVLTFTLGAMILFQRLL